MKLIILLLTLVGSVAMATESCPNFSGRYDEPTYHRVMEVTQVGCKKMSITYFPIQDEPENFRMILDLVMDGSRHEFWQIFTEAKWEKNQLIINFWSKETGGEIVSETMIWEAQKSADGKMNIHQTLIDPDHSEPTRTMIFSRL